MLQTKHTLYKQNNLPLRFMNQNQEIYANLELALMLQNAGWKKHTNHKFLCVDGDFYCQHDSSPIVERFDSNGEIVRLVINLRLFSESDYVYSPTLSEIEIPDSWFVYSVKGLYNIGVRYKDNTLHTIDYGYKSEIEARCMAWILADRQSKVDGMLSDYVVRFADYVAQYPVLLQMDSDAKERLSKTIAHLIVKHDIDYERALRVALDDSNFVIQSLPYTQKSHTS